MSAMMCSGLKMRWKAMQLSRKTSENGFAWPSKENHLQGLKAWGDLYGRRIEIISNFLIEDGVRSFPISWLKMDWDHFEFLDWSKLDWDHFKFLDWLKMDWDHFKFLDWRWIEIISNFLIGDGLISFRISLSLWSKVSCHALRHPSLCLSHWRLQLQVINDLYCHLCSDKKYMDFWFLTILAMGEQVLIWRQLRSFRKNTSSSLLVCISRWGSILSILFSTFKPWYLLSKTRGRESHWHRLEGGGGVVWAGHFFHLFHSQFFRWGSSRSWSSNSRARGSPI